MFDISTFRNLDGFYSNRNNNNDIRLGFMPQITKKSDEKKIDNYDNTIIGMPVRTYSYRTSNKKNSDQEYQNNTDFNLFDKNSNLAVSSYDSSNQINYSDITNFGTPLITPVKNSPDYFMILLINCFSFDIVLIINSIMTKLYGISPINVMHGLNFIYNFYVSRSNNFQMANIKCLINFFQFKTSEYINTSLVKLSTDLNNFTNLNNFNVFVINDKSYKDQATEFNKYLSNTCITFYINESNQYSISNQINNMIEQKTNKLINFTFEINSEILNISNKTGKKIFLYNFSVFLLVLKTPFLKQNTKKGIFHGCNDRLISYMEIKNTNNYFYQNADVILVEFECINGINFGIIIHKTKKIIKYQEIEKYFSLLKMTSFEYIIIPKIKYQTKIKLNETFKKIGLDCLFTNMNFNIFSFEHYTTILFDDVVENTSFGVNTISNNILIDDKQIKLKVNKPFMFYVRTVNNNCINLIGKFY